MPDPLPLSSEASTLPKTNRPLNTSLNPTLERLLPDGQLLNDIHSPADVYQSKIGTEAAFALVIAAVIYLIVRRRASRRDGFLVLGTIALIGCVLFPPFSFQATSGYTTAQGYGSLFDPPKKTIGTQELGTYVNIPLLWTELLVISAATGVAYLPRPIPNKDKTNPNAEISGSEKA